MELETLLWMSINLLIWRDQELHFKDQKILKTLKIYQTLYFNLNFRFCFELKKIKSMDISVYVQEEKIIIIYIYIYIIKLTYLSKIERYKDQFLRWVDQSLAFQDLEQIDLYQNLGKIAYKMLYRETGLEQLDL